MSNSLPRSIESLHAFLNVGEVIALHLATHIRCSDIDVVVTTLFERRMPYPDGLRRWGPNSLKKHRAHDDILMDVIKPGQQNQ